jgi:hypothetical protein
MRWILHKFFILQEGSTIFVVYYCQHAKLNMVIKFTSDTCQHEIRSLFRSSSFFLHFFYDRFILYQGNKFQIVHRNKIKTPKISLLISPHSIIRCQDVRIRGYFDVEFRGRSTSSRKFSSYLKC